MYLVFAFILFPLAWIPIALATATIVLPGFQISLPAAIFLSLVVPVVQVLIGLPMIPLAVKYVLSFLVSYLIPTRTNSWLEKFQAISQSWLLWLLSSCLGYGLILGLLWLAKSFLPGVAVRDQSTLLWAALILQWLPQTAQEEFAKPLKTLPITWRSILAVILGIVSFPLIPLSIAWLGNTIPNSGLTITPLLAAVTYAIYRSIVAGWQSILNPLTLTWRILFPGFPKLEALIENLPESLQWLSIIVFLAITLPITIIPLWLATKIVLGTQIIYPMGLVTFAVASIVSAICQGMVIGLAGAGGTEN